MLPWKRMVAKKEKGSTQSQGKHGSRGLTNITRIHRKRAIQWAPHPANLYFVRVSHNLCLFHLKLQRWQEELPLCPAWDVQKRKTPKPSWKLAQKWQFLQSTRVEIALLLLGSARQWLFLLSTHFPIIPAQLPSEDEAHVPSVRLNSFCCASHLHCWGPSRGASASKQAAATKKYFIRKLGASDRFCSPVWQMQDFLIIIKTVGSFLKLIWANQNLRPFWALSCSGLNGLQTVIVFGKQFSL